MFVFVTGKIWVECVAFFIAVGLVVSGKGRRIKERRATSQFP